MAEEMGDGGDNAGAEGVESPKARRRGAEGHRHRQEDFNGKEGEMEEGERGGK